MAVAELHFFAADDLNGDTIYECTTDDPWVQQIEIEPSLSHLGHGRVKFARRVGESMIASGIISAGVFVRVLIPAISTTRYLWGFFINARSQRVVDKDEKGGEYFEFGGPGPKYYLTNAILWETEYGDGAGIPDQDAGIWTWQGSARPGAILNRLILEDVAHATNFLPDLTKSFSDTDDSDSVAWSTDVTVGDDFTLNMGSNYLELLWVLENIGNLETDINLGTVASPLMQLDAYQTFGRDLTGAQAADTVHFTEGVNILSEMEVGGDTLLRASHALVRGAEGTWKHAIRTSWSPGDPVRAIGYDFTVSSYEPTLEAAGKRFLRAHDVDGEVDLNMQPGWAPADGLYMPGPDGTNGHFWYGDTVSLTTGLGSPSVLDYSADDKRVMAINMKLAEAVDDSDATSRAVSWLINVKFDKERTSNATSPSGSGSGDGGTHSNCTCIRLCRISVEGSAEAYRMYPSIDTSSLTPPAASVLWDHDPNSGSWASKAMWDVPSVSTAGGSSSASMGTGGVDVRLAQFAIELDAARAAVLDAGGAVLRAQFRVKSRHGIGITEANQHNISQITVRVYDSSGVLRGTAYAGHSLASSAGSVEWLAADGGRNAMFPPAAASNVLSAVAGTVAGDWLVVEVGYRSFSTSTTGATLFVDDSAASDLPEDETTLTNLRSWIQIAASGVGAIEGDLPLDTVRQDDEATGTSGRASRCDHQHAHGLLSESGTHYHSREDVEGSADLTLDELADVEAPSPADGDTLEWDDSEGLWVSVERLSDDVPLVESGAGDAGTGTSASRSDHVHPADGGGAGGGVVPWGIVPAYGNNVRTNGSLGAANRCIYVPVVIPADCTLTGVRLRTVAGTSGNQIAVALYDDAGSRVATSGAVTSPATGLTTITFTSSYAASAGRYWIAVSVNSTSLTIQRTDDNTTAFPYYCLFQDSAHPPPTTMTSAGATTVAPNLFGVISGVGYP